jgi:hypothetical protein
MHENYASLNEKKWMKMIHLNKALHKVVSVRHFLERKYWLSYNIDYICQFEFYKDLKKRKIF